MINSVIIAYKQLEGALMGYLLSPVIANLFMVNIENSKHTLNNARIHHALRAQLTK